ncbi:hypothetical protein [Cupriavidus metallidurans]|uniref:hypothetical protein n=1 Tax=Cupriavidus metallidurans TaxID=119219 RepID=UPI001CCB99A3|nr:hypothetical protein [Cupriavidus metallidurans]UBM12698.1 hypothetical protein LAI70_28200 [Cupriavidus metallidurans]
MEERVLKGELSISRPSRGDMRDVIEIQVKDEGSGVRFLTVVVDPAVFALALTGLSGQEVELEVKGLDVVGKTKERRTASLTIDPDSPLRHYTKTKLSEHLAQHCQEPGWHLNGHLGSQHSIQHLPGGYVRLNYSYYRYVDPV